MNKGEFSGSKYDGLNPDIVRMKMQLPKMMKLRKIVEQIRFGFGQGHGEQYQPWMKIRRKNSTNKSNQVVAWMQPLGRVAHYFSRGEYKIALLLLWLGIEDLREQYPLWPISHPHPLEGADGSESIKRPWACGLLDIAREAGIDHGVVVGTDIPYVATIDLLATLRTHAGLKLVGISCKPYSRSDAAIRPRSLERLELERRYFEKINERYWVANSALLSNLMAGQLEMWMECSVLNESPNLYLLSFRFAAFLEEHPQLSIAEAVIQAAQAFEIDQDDAWQLFRYCSWFQLIDIDPTKSLVTSHPIQRGGRALRAKLRSAIFGEDAQ